MSDSLLSDNVFPSTSAYLARESLDDIVTVGKRALNFDDDDLDMTASATSASNIPNET